MLQMETFCVQLKQESIRSSNANPKFNNLEIIVERIFLFTLILSRNLLLKGGR